MNKVDIVYAVPSKLGTSGIGSLAYNAIKGIENSKKFTYRVFCRGYKKELDIDPKKIFSYGYLELLSYPFRFLEKKLKLNINSFKLVNYLFGRKVYQNIPPCKIYHAWMGISPRAVNKAKENGAIIVSEASSSHPLTALKLLNEEYKKFGREEFIQDKEKFAKKVEYLKMFDYFLCSSDFVYKSFLEQGFKENKLIKLPYGVDINKFNSEKEKTDGKFRAVFVGSVQLRKGIQYLLQAWEELNLKNAELLIIGTIWPDATKICDKYKENKTIFFKNFDPDLKKYYKKANIFVFPSIEEGSALVNYEAMASGVPIITTFNSGSVVRNNKDGFIIPIRDVKAIKDKINFLYKNPKKGLEMGNSAREHIKNFSWELYGERLVKEYESILKKEGIA